MENEKVASQLIERGRLRKRVTIIPLNKIQAFKISAEVRLKETFQSSATIIQLVLNMLETYKC